MSQRTGGYIQLEHLTEPLKRKVVGEERIRSDPTQLRHGSHKLAGRRIFSSVVYRLPFIRLVLSFGPD